jgi:hypothetical protein
MVEDFRHKGIGINYVVKIFKIELVQTVQHPASHTNVKLFTTLPGGLFCE